MSVIACVQVARFDNLYAICRLRHAFNSLSAVLESKENPSGGNSRSPITLYGKKKKSINFNLAI